MKSNREGAAAPEEERGRSSYSELPEMESPSKVTPKKGKGGNRELRILRRSKTLKEKNDPDRFSGDGINFKAKIIGTEHVLDARGNRMCQGALQRLKAAVKTSGDHKQKIILNISLSGIIIKDDKSGEILHHHPIHKISFISQDTSDNRAFGYVFGCPQTGHEFFGIKTEKIASQVVLTLRDLFLTALELKKKEIESAIEGEAQDSPPKENTKTKISPNGVSDSAAANVAEAIENGYEKERGLHSELLYSNIVSLPDEEASQNGHEKSPAAEPAIDTLLDLQFTVDSLQQGISHMDQSIASAVSQGFGFSFSEDDVSESSSNSIPISFHLRMDKLSSLYQETLSLSSRSSSTSDYVCASENKTEDTETLKRDLSVSISSATSDQSVSAASAENGCSTPNLRNLSAASSQNNISALPNQVEDKYAVFLDIDAIPSIFDNPDIAKTTAAQSEELNFSMEECHKESFDVLSEMKTSTPIVFAELDPLGNHPYVDKKDFFQELKNPPKKVLKDLVSADQFETSSNADSSHNKTDFDSDVELFQGFPESDSSDPQPPFLNSLISQSGQSQFNPFAPPPKLPPKKATNVVPAFPHLPEVTDDSLNSKEDPDVKNPFNPFVLSDYPDIPPPSSPPPPPPPRLPTKVSGEAPLSPPPPRPPSRSNGAPTPPLPKRRSPFTSSNQTWFSFDQDALAVSRLIPEPDASFDQFAPPIPSPARKFPPVIKHDCSPLKSSSASNSPATLRRMSNHSPLTETGIKLNSVKSNMPRKILSRHSSLLHESEVYVCNASFPEISSIAEQSVLDDNECLPPPNESPPLPPKPNTISRPRPSPSKKIQATLNSSSFTGSNFSAADSSNGTHSSSSLVFSSSEEGKMGSSAEPIFFNSGEHSDIFPQNISSDKVEQSSSRQPGEELSPDSIFRRKSDPFADEFFLTLPKKSGGTKSVQKGNCSNGVEVCFKDFESST